MAVVHKVVGIDHLDATHVGGHPQRTIAHLHDGIHIVVVAIGIECHTREGPGHRIEERQASIAAHPYALPIVEADAAHIVARQALARNGPILLETSDGTARQAHHAHAMLAMTDVETTLPIIEQTAVLERLFEGQRRERAPVDVHALHFAASIDQPNLLVGSTGNVLDTR